MRTHSALTHNFHRLRLVLQVEDPSYLRLGKYINLLWIIHFVWFSICVSLITFSVWTIISPISSPSWIKWNTTRPSWKQLTHIIDISILLVIKHALTKPVKNVNRMITGDLYTKKYLNNFIGRTWVIRRLFSHNWMLRPTYYLSHPNLRQPKNLGLIVNYRIKIEIIHEESIM